jgi:hypothetical protein
MMSHHRISEIKSIDMPVRVWKGEVKDDGLVLTMWVDVTSDVTWHVEVALTCSIASCDVCDRFSWNRL